MGRSGTTGDLTGDWLFAFAVGILIGAPVLLGVGLYLLFGSMALGIYLLGLFVVLRTLDEYNTRRNRAEALAEGRHEW